MNDPPWPGCESVTPAARGGHYYAEMRASLSGARPFGSLSHLDRFIISLDLYNFILKLIKIFKFHKNKIYIKKIFKTKISKNLPGEYVFLNDFYIFEHFKKMSTRRIFEKSH